MELLYSLTLCDGGVSAIKQKETLSTKKQPSPPLKPVQMFLREVGQKCIFNSGKGCWLTALIECKRLKSLIKNMAQP